MHLSRGVVAVVLSVALITGAAPPALAAGPVDAKQYLIYDDGPGKKWGFRSADGNLRCFVDFNRGYDEWGCVARSHRWSDRRIPVQASCTASLSGSAFVSTYAGGFRRLCSGRLTAQDDHYRVLPSGRSIAVDGITCTASRPKGAARISCTGPKGSRLTMSRTRLAFTDPH